MYLPVGVADERRSGDVKRDFRQPRRPGGGDAVRRREQAERQVAVEREHARRGVTILADPSGLRSVAAEFAQRRVGGVPELLDAPWREPPEEPPPLPPPQPNA